MTKVMKEIERIQKQLVKLQNEVMPLKYSNASEEFIKEHQKQWIETGKEYKNWRENHGISMAEVSRNIGCSAKTVKKFENGNPVKAALMIENAYDMYKTLFEVIKIFDSYNNQIKNLSNLSNKVDVENEILDEIPLLEESLMEIEDVLWC